MPSPLRSFLYGFGGYALGRLGHVYYGHLDGPHHWIPGLLLVAYGMHRRSMTTTAFGSGLFVSDLKDFTEMKIWSPDEDDKRWFWGFD